MCGGPLVYLGGIERPGGGNRLAAPFPNAETSMRINQTLAIAACWTLFLLMRTPDAGARDWIFPADASTSNDQAVDERQYFDHFVELYQQHTRDTGELKSQATELLRIDAAQIAAKRLSPAARVLADDPLLSQEDKVLSLAQRVVLSGSNDPLVIKVLASHSVDKPYDWRLRTIDRAVETYNQSDYPIAVRWRLLSDQAWYADEASEPNAEDVSVDQLYKILPDYLAYVSPRPPMHRAAIRSVESLFSDQRLHREEGKAMIAALIARQDVDPWLAQITCGYFYHQLGWRYRGTAFASKVDAEKMRRFEESERQAAEHFLNAHSLRQDRPEAAAGLINITNAIGPVDGRDAADWFQASLLAQIDFPPAQSGYRNSLLPRWGGSHEAMLQFGIEMARSDRYDTALPDALISSLYDLYAELEDWNAVLAVADVQPHAIRHLDRRIVQIAPAGDVPMRRFYGTQAMALAFYHLDFHDAVVRQQSLQDQLDPEVLKSFDLNSKAKLASMHAYDQFGLQPFATGVDDDLRNRPEDGKAKYVQFANPQAYIERLTTDVVPRMLPEAEPFVERQLRLARLGSDYRGGRWVNLEFDDDFSDWYGIGEPWQFIDPSAAMVDASGRIDVSHVLLTPGPREIEWTAVVASGAPKRPLWERSWVWFKAFGAGTPVMQSPCWSIRVKS